MNIADVERIMAAHHPRLRTADDRRCAAVAAIFNEGSEGLRLLFIERAKREGDPWSGHLAFPGGRIEEGDSGPRAAAERETLEEIGLDLRSAECLGRLDDVVGTSLPILVSGFVYGVERFGRFELSDEVRDAFWVHVEDLIDPERHVERIFSYRGFEETLPAIDLLGPERPVLWGLTYRLVTRFLHVVGYEIPRMPDS